MENQQESRQAPTGLLNKRQIETERFRRLSVEEIHIPLMGYVGRDPEDPEIVGHILERGYGLMMRYRRGNYARIFIDASNDAGRDTPSVIFDLPESNKLKIQDNAGGALVRVYGIGSREVGGPATFTGYGAFDLFCPMRYQEYTVGGANDPETIGAYSQNGFTYVRNSAGTRTLRIYLNGSWKTVTVT